jgi:hypothetical protein
VAGFGVLVLVWIALGLLTPLVTLGLVAAVAPLANRVGASRRLREAAPSLPTSAPIVALATGWSPPIRWRGLVRIYFFGFLAGPLGIEVATVLLLRWHMPCTVVVTADDTVWLLHPRSKWRRRGKILVGRQSLVEAKNFRRGRIFSEGEVGGESIGLFRSPVVSRLVEEPT